MSISPRSSAIANRRCRRAHAAIFVSQSGETADTLAALRYCNGRADRLSRWSMSPKARSRGKAIWRCRSMPGREIGVASTKAFTCQLTGAAIAGAQGRARPRRDHGPSAGRPPVGTARPAGADDPALEREEHRASRIAWRRRPGRLVPGPRAMYPLALEGALKLKEISYIHAEGLCQRRTEARPHRAGRQPCAGDRAWRRATRCSTRPCPTCRR